MLTDSQKSCLSVLRILEEHQAFIPLSVFGELSKAKLAFETELNNPNSRLTFDVKFMLLHFKQEIERFESSCGILSYTPALILESLEITRLQGIMEESDRGPSSDKAEHSGDS